MGSSERSRNTHNELRVSALERTGEALQTQPGVSHHNDRTQFQTGVDKGGEAGPGRNHEVHAVTGAHPQLVKLGGCSIYPVSQLLPGELNRHLGAVAFGVHINHSQGSVSGAFGECR